MIASDAFSPLWLDRTGRADVCVAFCDPPYAISRDPLGAERVIQLLERLAPQLEDDAIAVLRTEERHEVRPAAGYARPQTHRYGSQAIHLYERVTPD